MFGSVCPSTCSLKGESLKGSLKRFSNPIQSPCVFVSNRRNVCGQSRAAVDHVSSLTKLKCLVNIDFLLDVFVNFALDVEQLIISVYILV